MLHVKFEVVVTWWETTFIPILPLKVLIMIWSELFSQVSVCFILLYLSICTYLFQFVSFSFQFCRTKWTQTSLHKHSISYSNTSDKDKFKWCLRIQSIRINRIQSDCWWRHLSESKIARFELFCFIRHRYYLFWVDIVGRECVRHYRSWKNSWKLQTLSMRSIRHVL